jgi:hypothetical protein
MGTTVPQLRRLTCVALAMLKDECGITLRLEAIPANALRITPDHRDRPGIIASARLGEAFLLSITYGVKHWSVFEGMQHNRLRFFDSAGWRSLSLSRVKVHGGFRLVVESPVASSKPEHTP